MEDKRYIINEYLEKNKKIPDDILYIIIGKRNHEWWSELAQNKQFLDHINSNTLMYGVFDSDCPSNLISFCHDYLNHSFVAMYVDTHINYNFSDMDHIKFKNFFDKHQIKMHSNEVLFYEWLQKPIDIKEDECYDDDFFSCFGE